MQAAMTRLLPLLLPLTACLPASTASGTLCLGSLWEMHSPETAEFPADSEFVMTWRAQAPCLSGSCTERQASCEVSVRDNVVSIEASASWTHSIAFACTADCATIAAQCPVPALAAGAWQLKLNGREFAFEVPSTSDRCPFH